MDDKVHPTIASNNSNNMAITNNEDNYLDLEKFLNRRKLLHQEEIHELF